MISKAGSRREMSAIVRSASDNYRDYVLAQLRVARKRAQLLVNEIETIGVALSQGAIDPDTALEDMHNAGTLWFLSDSNEVAPERVPDVCVEEKRDA